MATIKNLFPLGIATGAAHCNRQHERDDLKDRVRNGHHTWLWARRRMGKTSLIEQVLGELRRGRPAIPSMKLDLNVVHDGDSLEQSIRRGAARLAIDLLPKGEKKTRSLEKAFDAFRPEFSFGGFGVKMTLRKPDAPAPGITDVLMSLDAAAGQYKKRIVIVLDEFQQLSSLTVGRTNFTLEGAIRHAVERAKHTTYVFSGSQRHLLADMFTNPDRPLYRLCDKVTLQRIAANHYDSFLNRASKARWSKPLPDEVTVTILAVTQRHPYYVNALCSKLWMNDHVPTKKDVNATWARVAEQDTAVVAHQIRTLSATQRAMLVGIAQQGRIEHPTGRLFLAGIRLSASTGSSARDVLEEADLIRQSDDGWWELINPVMAAYIRELSK